MGEVIVSPFAGTPAMRELTVSNHLLGDREALDATWERDGYWFFRDVLDKDAIRKVRETYLEVLGQLGVLAAGDGEAALYNGASLDEYPIKAGGNSKIDPLLARYPSKEFVKDPKIKSFFEDIFGGEVFWIPNSEFHAVPPQQVPPPSRFNFIHADGFANKGLPLRICWIPVSTIDEVTGGLAIAEGLHKPRMNDFPRLGAAIPETDVPVYAWRRTVYQPGDVLMFNLELPHSGLANLSDRFFRLSMDLRGMLKSDGPPVVGHVSGVDRCAIAVVDDEGSEHIFRVDEDTYCRVERGLLSGFRIALEEIPELVKVGAPVYVASHHGTATFIRYQH